MTWSDTDLLRALGGATLVDGELRPTAAGLLLFGTTMALRRCFPMMRVDYVRIPGKEWVSNPDRRFDTIEIRSPLLLAARRAIAAVRDDLPASFSLPEGEAMRTDETVLPMRVLREAIVNAVMHRSYRIHGAIQILRYANRLEIRNPGHSLKAEEQLGDPGSQTRNPRIAAVFHDVHFAETKGSGIRAMREVMQSHDLMPPTFESSRRPDQFVATFLFHHFLSESDLVWLRQLKIDRLSDEESRALVFVREVGAIDNAAYRTINATDTLDASIHLRRLRDFGVLEMKGAGSRTYYVPGPGFISPKNTEVQALDLHKLTPDLHKLTPDLHKLTPDLHSLPPELQDLPSDLHARLPHAGQRPRSEILRALILDLCRWRPLGARELAILLGNRDVLGLTRMHLRPMIQAGDLDYTIEKMPKHPRQQYTLPTEDGPDE
ncbi:MAG: ATP-binding protein [Bradymonadaceae bacterium]